MLRGRADAAQAKYLGGQGVARQRQAIINGLRDSIKNFSSDVEDVNSKDVIEMMMLTQYFDMLRDVGARCAHDSMRLPSARQCLLNVNVSNSNPAPPAHGAFPQWVVLPSGILQAACK